MDKKNTANPDGSKDRSLPATSPTCRSSYGCLFLVLAGIVYILGGMAIDLKIISASMVLILAVLITFILGRLGYASRKWVLLIRGAVIPAVILFWIAWGYAENWRVVPTTEYIEDDPRGGKIAGHRAVILKEPSEFQLERNSLRIDGATSLHDFTSRLAGPCMARMIRA